MKGWTPGDVMLAYNEAKRTRQDPFAEIARKLYITRDEAKQVVKEARKAWEKP